MSQPRSGFKALLESVKNFTDPQTAFTVYGVGPDNVTMTYPAVRYEKDDEDVKYADNQPYDITDAYLVTVIEEDPNTPIAKLVRTLPLCSFNRYFVAGQHHHTVYKIFF